MKILKFAGFFLGGIIVVLVVLWFSCGPNQPSDAKLRHLFEQHRTDLERLVQMTEEDWQMSRIAPDFMWRQDTVAWPRPESEWGISKQRWDEYRSLFARVGLKNGLTRREKSADVIFYVWSWGIVPAGISVGYLHCGQPHKGYAHTEEPCIENRDAGSGMHGQSTSYGYRYEKIAPNWYIYEESN